MFIRLAIEAAFPCRKMTQGVSADASADADVRMIQIRCRGPVVPRTDISSNGGAGRYVPAACPASKTSRVSLAISQTTTPPYAMTVSRTNARSARRNVRTGRKMVPSAAPRASECDRASHANGAERRSRERERACGGVRGAKPFGLRHGGVGMKTTLAVCASAAVVLTVFAGRPSADGEPTKLLRMPTVSASEIAFAYANNIWTVGRAGGMARRITSFQGQTTNPHFSPDGKS